MRRIHRVGFSGRRDRAAAERFDLERVLGIGATGEVYSARDHDLERTVAVKVLTQAADDQRFVGEARITASLQHPNVMPIYEMDVDDDGQLYFTMKQIDGQTLGEAVMLSCGAQRAERIRSFSDLAGIVVAIANALAYAHHQGIVHQDVKPDNIMLGTFGEVLLLDWGSASTIPASSTSLFGTPLYMSPEQARRERCDRVSDVYCLGSTLFHALLLRPPTWDDDPERFWQKKCAGIIDGPTSAERLSVPVVLLDIALKALAADPAQRYPDVDAMAGDLRAFLSGLAVSAHRDSLRERWLRWYRRHRRDVWIGVAASAVCVTLAAALYGERLQQIATWGPPRYAEDFSSGQWKTDWISAHGRFEVREGRLVAQEEECLIVLDRVFVGDTAIEYRAEIPRGTPPGDISMFWMRGDAPLGPGEFLDRPGIFRCQVGAHGGTRTSITSSGNRILADSFFQPRPGIPHLVRVEIRDCTITMFVDGAEICSFTDPFPLNCGRPSFYSYFMGKTFDDVRIFSLGVARKIDATAIGDTFAQEGEYAKAIVQYRRVAESHPGAAIGQEACYKQGLCQFRLEQWEAADLTWQSLAGTRWDSTIALLRCEHRFSTNQHQALLAEWERLHLVSPALRPQIIRQWTNDINQLAARGWKEDLGSVLEAYLSFHQRCFPDDGFAGIGAAAALTTLGRWQEVLDRFPRETRICCDALFHLGREAEILDRYPFHRDMCTAALYTTGRASEIATRFPDASNGTYDIQGRMDRGEWDAVPEIPVSMSALMIRAGRSDELLERLAGRNDVTSRHARTKILVRAGRSDELTVEERTDIRALMAMNQVDEALARYDHDRFFRMWPRHYLGLEAFIRGDVAAAERWFTVPADVPYDQTHFYLPHFLLVPFLRELAGDAGALSRSLEELAGSRRYLQQQRPWYGLRFVLGIIDEPEHLAQPTPVYARVEVNLLRGMRLERTGRAAEAVDSYRAFLANPSLPWGEQDPIPTRFAEWRIDQLSASGR